MPARFSCRTVFSADRRTWSVVNNGWDMIPDPANMSSASGSTGNATSVSLKLVVSRIISVPTSSTNACNVMINPWPMNRRTFSTSSVARIISCPVWLRSW